MIHMGITKGQPQIDLVVPISCELHLIYHRKQSTLPWVWTCSSLLFLLLESLESLIAWIAAWLSMILKNPHFVTSYNSRNKSESFFDAFHHSRTSDATISSIVWSCSSNFHPVNYFFGFVLPCDCTHFL